MAAELQKLRFFSAWFCPYAQRTWITLNHCKIDYEKVEGLVLDHEDTSKAKGYTKDPRLLQANPDGLVPTIIPEPSKPDCPAVCDSLITVEYVDELAKAKGYPTVMPEHPLDRARARMTADWINRNICSPYYNVLVRKDQVERRTAWDKVVTNLHSWSQQIRGPFFFGSQVSIVDISVFPWVYRITDARVVEVFRGWKLDMSEEKWVSLATWRTAMLDLPGVQGTLADPDKLRASYQRYADGTAQSKVAEAVRQGKAAHDEKSVSVEPPAKKGKLNHACDE